MEEPREPELLTHHEHNGTGPHERYDDYEDGYDDQRFAEFGPDGEDPQDEDGKPVLTPEQRKKRRWRRIRRTMYALVGVFLVLPAIAFAVTYFFVDVPTPEEVAAQQGKIVTYYYANGAEMGKEVPDNGNRVLLKPEQIPDVVKHAVYAAEDASFETNSGFDVTGILRAVFNQLTGGQGGGSTISQQYIKKATENEDPTLTRKFTELVKSFKMNNQQDKKDIITAYLNTIYFGRGANGIQTAAQAYFKKDVKDLSPSEAALLAGLIQGPGRSGNTAYATQRWNFVMDQLVAHNWLSRAERAGAQFPTPIPVDQAKPQLITGPASLIQGRVKAELEAKGYPEEKLLSGGYKIYTTIDPKAQKIAEDTVKQVMDGQPQELKEALVAVDPKTGGVQAYYGGQNTREDARDWANTQRAPGSSFKPFDLVALLQKGKGLGEVYDGTSPREFGSATVRNSDGLQCPQCTVASAMEQSINTVFYDIVANDTGVDAVVKAAKAAGIPDAHAKPTMKGADNNISIGGGTTQVTPEDMAAAYATFAADGVHRQQHFVAKLANAQDETVFEVKDEGTPAFSDGDPEKSKQIAGNVTESLQPVVKHSHLDCEGGRECAGKTGTHQYVDPGGKSVNENAEAWMVGYTPSISATAWVGTGENKPIRTSAGKRIYGSGLPGEMWQKFMNAYLKGTPMEKFPPVKPIGKPVPVAPPPTTPSAPPTSSALPTTTPPSTPETPTETSTQDSGWPGTRTRPGYPTTSNGGGLFGPDPGNGNQGGGNNPGSGNSGSGDPQRNNPHGSHPSGG
jgi:membrane peptidoglycan carboxypeptidase